MAPYSLERSVVGGSDYFSRPLPTSHNFIVRVVFQGYPAPVIPPHPAHKYLTRLTYIISPNLYLNVTWGMSTTLGSR